MVRRQPRANSQPQRGRLGSCLHRKPVVLGLKLGRLRPHNRIRKTDPVTILVETEGLDFCGVHPIVKKTQWPPEPRHLSQLGRHARR